jgi:tetratricopeptide (TPR) repeat protein
VRSRLIIAAVLGLFVVLGLRMLGDKPPGPMTQGAGEAPVAGAEPVQEEAQRRVPGIAQKQPPGLSALPGNDGDQWARRNDDAIEALVLGELERAVELFERCLEANPEQDVFAKNLAEALARLARRAAQEDPGALDMAIALLERALELDGTRDDLHALLARWKAALEAEGEFWTDETAHFILSYDGERTELLKHGYTEITRLLEDVYGEFHDVLNHEPVGAGEQKIRVLLYDREEFTRITGVGHWAGGVFDGTIRIPVKEYARERRSFERVLRHELVHAFVQSIAGKDVPAWINEGLAQWLEDRNRVQRVELARERLAGKPLFALSDLQRSFTTLGDEEQIATAYAQSLAFLASLEQWYGDQVLFEMLRGCGTGRTCEETFLERTAQDLDIIAADFAREF